MASITESPEREHLLGRIAELEGQLRDAQETIREMKEQIESLERSGKRQAVPFERRKKVKKPKKRGRRKGQGHFNRREKPREADINETKKAEICGCPNCGGELTDLKEHEQYEIDIPKVKPIITRYVMVSGSCTACDERHWMTHPDQISRATGAAGVVVGPRTKALASDLKHRFGASYGRLAKCSTMLFS